MCRACIRELPCARRMLSGRAQASRTGADEAGWNDNAPASRRQICAVPHVQSGSSLGCVIFNSSAAQVAGENPTTAADAASPWRRSCWRKAARGRGEAAPVGKAGRAARRPGTSGSSIRPRFHDTPKQPSRRDARSQGQGSRGKRRFQASRCTSVPFRARDGRVSCFPPPSHQPARPHAHTATIPSRRRSGSAEAAR